MLKKELNFLKLCKENNYSQKEISSFKKALSFSRTHLKEEKLLSGEPVINHNISLGCILVKSKLFPEVVIAGILYGLEKKVLPEEITEKFNREISDLVLGQTQLKIIKSKNKTIEAETLKKVLLTSLRDVRIIFIKLADKLDNLLNIKNFPLDERNRIAQEVLEIYAPIANRFDLRYLKKQLEEEAFKIINPRKYKEISNFLKESKEERELFVKNFIRQIKDLLKGKVHACEINGREKSVYSIYQKIISRKVSLHKQKDHFAARVIVSSEEDCYNVLGILHQHYDSVPGTLRDYISQPKPSGYQSLHTLLQTPNKKEIEVQIRTQKMDDIAEEGVASHWSYKKSATSKSDMQFEKKTAWLRSVLDLQNLSRDKEFLKTMELNFFGDTFYCYTPKGRAIELPKKSTLLDFAYYIHQEIGNHAIGGRVNNVFSSLKKELNSGDVIEIVVNKHQRPRRDWLKFVVSSRAKTGICKGIKKHGDLPASKSLSIKPKEKKKFEDIVFSKKFPASNFILAKCCSPLPKEELAGVIKSQRKILVHAKNCKKIKNIQDKAIPVFWKESFNMLIKIIVQASDRSGVLADILNTISREGFIIKEANAKLLSHEVAECFFVVVPQKLDNIVRLIKKIKHVRGVTKISFG